MEYAWGIAASKKPFPAEFAAASRSKPKAAANLSSLPLPPPPPQATTTSASSTKAQQQPPQPLPSPASPPLPSSSSTRPNRLRIPSHSRPPSQQASQPSSSSSSSRPRSRSRDQGFAEALMSPDSQSPGVSHELLSRVSSHPTPSAPSALTHDDRRRPASATIGSRLHRSRSRSGRSSTTSATNYTTSYTTNSGKPDDAAQSKSNTRAQQRPASTSAAVVGTARTSSLTSSSFQDKQLPALPNEASTPSSSSSPRRAETCDAIDEYDDHFSTYPGPLMSRASTLSTTDGAGSQRDWQGDHNTAAASATASAPLLSAATSGPPSQHRRPPSLKPSSSTTVCDASKKSRSPLSFSRSRAQHQDQHQYHHNHQPSNNHNNPDSGASHRLVQNHELSRKPLSTPRANAASSSPSTSTSTNPPARRRDRRQSNHATMVGTESIISSRTESVAESVGARTIMSSEPPYREGDGSSTKSLFRPSRPFVTKSNGRTYLNDTTLAYPLPVDLHEMHRQSLRTLLLFQLFGGPLCSPFFSNKPPTRVLDVGCAYGFWSMMCHSFYSRKGFPNVHFTGLDIAALGGIAGMPQITGPPSGPKDRLSSTPTASSSHLPGHGAEQPPDKNMRWNFVQHDLRQLPLPFAEGEFDVIMCKDMSMTVPTDQWPLIIDDFTRILKPGGALEIWECDHPIRMLRPHVPDTPATGPGAAPPHTPNQDDSGPPTATPTEDKAGAEDGSTPSTPATATAASHSSSKKADYEKEVAELGAYVINNNTPLSGPQNNYLIEYNGWINKYMDAHTLLAFPCANVGALMVQEPMLTNSGSKRLAIPLSEVRWEREGVGGVVTKDGKSYIDTSKAIGKAAAAAGLLGLTKRGSSAGVGADAEDGPGASKKGKALSAGQLALRQAALQTVVQFIEGLEPALREVSGKKPDEWDTWMGKLMKELIERDGTSCGECLEVGAWWARKVQDS